GWIHPSAVQRGDAGVALEAVGDTGRVARIGQQRYHVLTVLPGRERRAIPFRQERLDRDAAASSPGAGCLMTERRLTHDLLWDQHLEVNAEPAISGDAVAVMGHDPEHAFSASIPDSQRYSRA